MFTSQEAKKIEEKYLRAIAKAGGRSHEFTGTLDEISGTEALCYQFLVGAMPISDLSAYSGALLLSFVRNSLEMRRTMPWGSRIPAEIFLNDVLFYRVNNENIDDYRHAFSKELVPRIDGKSMRGAALEVNYWCYEKATYESTDDRTASPLTVMKNGHGRCGEESAFAVSALRSVGIPARQCYAPKWSHCDDNHAWVEVWVDGGWYYMGACEPEPVLNKGWFTFAASKAMLVHSRLFSGFSAGERVIAQNGSTTELNHLDRYADTKELTVLVLDYAGKALPGAQVQFQVLNYSELSDIASLATGADGTAKLLTGAGDLAIHVCHEGHFLTKTVCVGETGSLLFDFSSDSPLKDGAVDFDFHPPLGKIKPEIILDESKLLHHQEKLKSAESRRVSCEKTFFNESSAAEFAARFPAFQPELARFLLLAKGNHREITEFLNSDFELADQISLLRQLNKKDFQDCKAKTLEDALRSAVPYKKMWDETVFQRYVLSPRIQDEFLFPYRAGISAFFSAEQRSAFQRNPVTVFDYIERNIKTCDALDAPSLIANPEGLLQMEIGSELSKRILFAAICRTFGIPARLNPVTGAAEFFDAGLWKDAAGRKAKTEKLTLKNNGYPLCYRQNFSIAKLVNGRFQSLEYSGLQIDGQTELEMEPGMYRILLSNRQIDGAVLARAYYIGLKPGEPAVVQIAGREGDIASRLKNLPIHDTELRSQSGVKESLSCLTANHPQNIIALIDVKKEPTEHLLNEFLALKKRYLEKKDTSVLLLVPDSKSFENELLKQTLAEMPTAAAYQYVEKQLCENLFDEVQAGDHRLPLVIVADDHMNARFQFSNYNVGTAALLLDIAEAMQVISG